MSRPDGRGTDASGSSASESAVTGAAVPDTAAREGESESPRESGSESTRESGAHSDSQAPHPSPRTVLITGPGGAGRTTVAAASALAAAHDGSRTLLLSGEPPSTLAPLLGMPATAAFAAPTEVPAGEGRLWAARVDSGRQFRSAATTLQERAGTVLELVGAEPLDEDEVTELPGADAFSLLSTLSAAHTAGEWDAVIVDLPHAPAALRMLALPKQLRRYLRRLLPPERQAARALRPALAQLVGVPMPTAALYETTARWEDELAAVEDVLQSPGTTVRLVAEPGPLALEALRVARAGLGLYGLSLDAVVANRVLPVGSSDAWLESMSGRQQSALRTLRAGCEAQNVPLCELPHLGRDPRGAGDLVRLAAAAGPYGADAGEPGTGSVENRLKEDGLLVWHLPLPAARKEELDLVRRGDELIVSVGPHRRVLPLPSALRRCRVVGAALEQGELRVRCAPDPAVWPQGPQS